MNRFYFVLSALASLGSTWSLAAPTDIALIQYNADAHFNDYATNIANLTRLAEEAASKGAQLIVLPEGSAYGYSDENSLWCSKSNWTKSECRDVAQVAERIPSGKTTRYWEKFSKSHHVFVAFNLPEVDGKKFYNTTAVTGPGGFVTKYRKRSLYYVDTYYATPGDLGPIVLDTPIGKFGMLICMDVNYPNYYSEYKNMGVSRIVSDMDWDDDPNGPDAAITYLQQMAEENGVDIFVSDNSVWDGTGAYRHGKGARERNGLPTVSPGTDGISYHSAD